MTVNQPPFLWRAGGFSLMDEDGAVDVERGARFGEKSEGHAEVHERGEQDDRNQRQPNQPQEIARFKFVKVAFHGRVRTGSK